MTFIIKYTIIYCKDKIVPYSLKYTNITCIFAML